MREQLLSVSLGSYSSLVRSSLALLDCTSAIIDKMSKGFWVTDLLNNKIFKSLKKTPPCVWLDHKERCHPFKVRLAYWKHSKGNLIVHAGYYRESTHNEVSEKSCMLYDAHGGSGVFLCWTAWYKHDALSVVMPYSCWLLRFSVPPGPRSHQSSPCPWRSRCYTVLMLDNRRLHISRLLGGTVDSKNYVCILGFVLF